MKVNLKNKRGISLIVLVITIIVMIILAAAIILSLNSSGIIEKANQAKTDSDEASVKEYVATLNAEWELMSETEKDASPYNGKVVNFVANKLEEKGYTNFGVAEKEDGTLEVAQKGGWKLETTVADGKVTNAVITNGKDTIEVGSVVNYTAPSSTNYTGTWKVLGVDSFGRILLISNDIGDQEIGATDASNKETGFLNAETILNNKCRPYADGKIAVSARSIKVEDINALTTFDKTTYGANLMYAYGNKVTYSWNGTNKPAYTSIKANKEMGPSGNLRDDHTNGFMYWDKASNTIKKVPYAASGTITTLEIDRYIYNGSKFLLNEKIQEMLFGVDKNEFYWLASRYCGTNTNYASFGVHLAASGGVSTIILVNSNDETYSYTYAVRAVVTLASNISLKEGSSAGTYIIK